MGKELKSLAFEISRPGFISWRVNVYTFHLNSCMSFEPLEKTFSFWVSAK